MDNQKSATRTLGLISARLITSLQIRGKIIFTLEDVFEIEGRKKQRALIKVLGNLVKRGVIGKVKSGVYFILQPGQENMQFSNWPIIADALAGSSPYFLSYYSAMRLHGMTIHPLLNVYVAMPKRARNRKIHDLFYQFIYVKPENFWGQSIYWVTKQDKVQVSDLERTILDGLDRPDLCGGIKEVIRGIWLKQKEIDIKRLIKYASRFHSKAAIKRLGFILEVFNFKNNEILLMEKLIQSAKDFILLDPNGPKKGKYLSRWHIQINIDEEEIKASVWE